MRHRWGEASEAHMTRAAHRAALPHPYGEQFFDVELEANAEHQQNDADLRKLFRHRCVGDEAGCVRTHQRARQQVTHNRRQSKTLREKTQYEGRAEASG
jgi:hypothetical protein